MRKFANLSTNTLFANLEARKAEIRNIELLNTIAFNEDYLNFLHEEKREIQAELKERGAM